MIYTNNQRIYTKNVGSNTKTKCNAFNVRSHKKKKARADVKICVIKMSRPTTLLCGMVQGRTLYGHSMERRLAQKNGTLRSSQ